MTVARAEPVISEIDWRPACDGSSIEVVSEHKTIQSVSATAIHASVITQWTIHYIGGRPVSAEHRELSRGRIADGDRAGDYSGDTHLTKILTWRWTGDRFPVEDDALLKELTDIMTIAQEQAEQNAPPNP
jgi:hypothetical protein